MTKPEKLMREGHLREAAEAFREKASQEDGVHKRRRFLNFAGRCYEAVGEFSLSAKSFLESGDVDRAIRASVKSGNPKTLSNALAETGYKEDETLRFLMKTALQLTEQRNFVNARAFAKEALDVKRSQLTEAMVNMIDGIIESKPDKLASVAKTMRFLGENDALAHEIGFMANKFLASMPIVEGGVNVPPSECPECGAPLPQKRKGKVVTCDYCGFLVRLD